MLVEQLKENYFFAVIRGKDKEDAKNIARYAIKGGIYNIEITFSTPKADEVIKELIEEFKDEKEILLDLLSKIVVNSRNILDSEELKKLINLKNSIRNNVNIRSILFNFFDICANG